jgi:hypothetical protein
MPSNCTPTTQVFTILISFLIIGFRTSLFDEILQVKPTTILIFYHMLLNFFDKIFMKDKKSYIPYDIKIWYYMLVIEAL